MAPDVRAPFLIQASAAASLHALGGERLPEFVPLPSGKATEIHTGLKRGSLNLLILPCEANGYRPLVASISLRKPNQSKGKRLIVLASLLTYLRSLQQKE